MATWIYPQSQQITAVTATQLPFVTGLLKLIKSSIALTPTLTAADLAAVECDFTGYAHVTFTALPAPYADSKYNGVSFDIPTQLFQVGSPVVTGNDVYGGWIEDSAHALLVAFLFNAPFPMQAAHVGMPLSLILNFYGSNQVYADIGDTPQ